MAVDALVRRHLAPPTNPVDRFSCVYLPRLLEILQIQYRHLCTQEADAWTVGRGEKKLREVEQSIAADALDRKRVNLMIKKEVNIVPFIEPKLPTKARGIQFCTNLRTAYELAVEQYSFGHALSRATNREVELEGVNFHVVYTAEMTPMDIADFAQQSEAMRSQYVQTYLDERDGKNWDANVQTVHRKAIAKLYGLIDGKLEAIARAAIKITGRYSSGGVVIRYGVDGTVKSGHWDTSSGNAALNIEVTVQAILALPVRIRPARVRGLVMGDDLLLWLYFNRPVDAAEYCTAINGTESALGIHPVRGIFNDILNVSFCSSTFYKTTSGGFALVPKLGRTFGKLFWTVTPLQNRDPRRLASTIAHAFYPMYTGYRPMCDFLLHHMRVQPIEDSSIVDAAVPYLCKKGVPRWEGVQWSSGNVAKYGLLPGTLDDLSQLLAGESGGLYHPAINVMIEQDSSDPCDRRGVLAF